MTRALLLFAIGCSSAPPAPPAPVADPSPSPPTPAPADAAVVAERTDELEPHYIHGPDAGTGGGGFGSSTNVGIGGGARPRHTPGPRYLTHGTIAIKGDYQQAVVLRYVRRRATSLQDCYERELRTTPKLAGTATMHFAIGADGKVTAASGSGFPKVDACATLVIAAIEFPKPPAGAVEITYPLIFQPAPKP